MSTKTLNILRVNASGRRNGSTTRQLSDALIEQLRGRHGSVVVTERDTGEGLKFVDEAWIGANFTPEDERSAAQQAALAHSDALVEEVKNADVLVIGVPVYNFGVPASLKAWIDMVARARKTFHYTENGPEGLLGGRKAYLVMASGGTEVGSDIDFATTYMRFVLGFLGITDVEVIAADRQMVQGEEAVNRARAQIAQAA